MTIHITCECGKQLHAPDEFAGQSTVCPACQRTVAIPSPEAPLQPATVLAAPAADVAITDLLPSQSPQPRSAVSKLAQASVVLCLCSVIVAFLLGIPEAAFSPYRFDPVYTIAPILLSALAMILGFCGLRAIRRNPQTLRGEGIAKGGIIVGCITALWLASPLLLPMFKAHDAAARIHSVSHLKQIGVACHFFHDAYLHFPADNWKLSWRVHVLPFLGQEKLYRKFHLDESWDSPHNQKLLRQMPLIYLDPRFQGKADRKDGLTYYRNFAGSGSVLGPGAEATLVEITNKNGASNTIIVVEAGEPIPWTKPEDLDFDENSPFGGPNRARVFAVLFADGHVQTLPQSFDRLMIRRLINWQNTEPVNLP